MGLQSAMRRAWVPLPVQFAALRAPRIERDVLALCVYRRANAESVMEMVQLVEEYGGETRLWALDEPAPSLRRWTLGSGAGGRFRHINGLAAGSTARRVMVYDDDVTLPPRSYRNLHWAIDRFDLDLAQPAHHPASEASHRITRQRPGVLARETTFVEIGPLFVVHERAHSDFLPFPEDPPMGWGTEARWFDAHTAGRRLGIVDCAPMMHHGVVGASYSAIRETEAEHARTQLERLGADSWRDIQRNVRLHRW